MNKLNVNLPALAAAALATTLVLGSTAAMADEVRVIERASSSAYQAPMARVISATPNIERFVETRQQCSEQVQQVTTQGSSNLGGVLVGSVIGGVAGSAIGKGTGKTIANVDVFLRLFNQVFLDMDVLINVHQFDYVSNRRWVFTVFFGRYVNKWV